MVEFDGHSHALQNIVVITMAINHISIETMICIRHDNCKLMIICISLNTCISNIRVGVDSPCSTSIDFKGLASRFVSKSSHLLEVSHLENGVLNRFR